MAKPGIGLGVLTPERCLACLDSFPGIGMNGQRHTRVFRDTGFVSSCWLSWPAVGMGTCQQGVLASLGKAFVSEPVGRWEAWCCPALLCPPLFSYPGYLSTLSQGLQCPSLTIKAELGSPQCCLRLTPVGTLLGAFGR